MVDVEGMRSAANTMRTAADEMRSAASNLAYALESHQRWMDDWLMRFQNPPSHSAPMFGHIPGQCPICGGSLHNNGLPCPGLSSQ